MIERERITTYYAFPHTDALLADHPDARRRDLTSLRNLRTASALFRFTGREAGRPPGMWRVGLRLERDLHRLDGAPHGRATQPAALLSRTPARRHAGIRIVDTETGAPLPPGESGEITVKGVYLMRTYYKVAPSLRSTMRGGSTPKTPATSTNRVTCTGTGGSRG